MLKPSSLAALLMIVGLCRAVPPNGERITQQELVRRTQELFSSVAPGNQAPWKRYFANDAIYFDETGRNMNKSELVASIASLPKGYSGTITLGKVQSRIDDRTAILSYDLDETETVYGQKMNARYHGTDTWLFRHSEWEIVAGQMFRYYEDPKPVRIDAAQLDAYVGTYELAPGVTRTISRKGSQLYSKRGDGPPTLILSEVPDLFFRPGKEGRLLFRHNGAGKVDALIDRRNNEDVLWKKM